MSLGLGVGVGVCVGVGVGLGEWLGLDEGGPVSLGDGPCVGGVVDGCGAPPRAPAGEAEPRWGRGAFEDELESLPEGTTTVALGHGPEEP